ncbi:MAG: hypothetical protein KJ067_09020 [Vicinamibacteria bacterium]|jgi:hypothetical protein|nr:hypothetical protein [Vicinamibacteria bacterium]
MRGAAAAFYRTGAIACLLTAAAHTAGHLQGPKPPANDTEAELARLMASYVHPEVGRTAFELLGGFSWIFSLYFLTLGATALLLLRLRRDDGVLLRAYATAQAASLGLALAVSLAFFFLIPTACTAVAAAGFAVAAAWPPPA